MPFRRRPRKNKRPDAYEKDSEESSDRESCSSSDCPEETGPEASSAEINRPTPRVFPHPKSEQSAD